MKADPLYNDFVAWKSQYGMKYGSEQDAVRFQNYKSNDAKIQDHNLIMGRHYSVAHNKFSDLTQEEFKAMYLGTFQQKEQKNSQFLIGHESQADSIDWVAKGAVSPVKDQGQCGSCWAFSTVGALEGLYAIKNGKIQTFSEQALVDCSDNGNEGCNGGLMDQAFEWVETHGIPTEDAYPYKAVDQTCKSFTSAFKDTGFVDVPQNSADQLVAALNIQPVAVAINAESWHFQFYSGGVMTFDCATDLDHGVLAVGYGTDNGKTFWKLKNSWGTGWGEKGYFRF